MQAEIFQPPEGFLGVLMSTSSCLTELGQECPTQTDEGMSTAVETRVRAQEKIHWSGA
jgi:hypothetical protein